VLARDGAAGPTLRSEEAVEHDVASGMLHHRRLVRRDRGVVRAVGERGVVGVAVHALGLDPQPAMPPLGGDDRTWHMKSASSVVSSGPAEYLGCAKKVPAACPGCGGDIGLITEPGRPGRSRHVVFPDRTTIRSASP